MRKLLTVIVCMFCMTAVAFADQTLDNELIRCAAQGDLECVKQNIDAGANVNAKDGDGGIALISAAFWGHKNIVEYLVEHGADIDAKDGDEHTALIFAAWNGHLDVVKYLVEHGADVNARKNNGKTALMRAAEDGHLDVVKYLVEHGADIKAQDNSGETALILATDSGASEIVQYLNEQLEQLEQVENVNKLFDCAKNGDLDCVKDVISGSNVDINAKDSTGATALVWAADGGHLDVVEYLVDCGANVNAKDDDGWTALMAAAFVEELDIVEYLVEHGANVKAKDNTGENVLIAAVRGGNLDIVKYLVEHSADVNAKDNNGWTVLMWAADKKRLDVVKYLVEQGVVIDAKNKDGKTALDLAKSDEIVQYLNEQLAHNTSLMIEIGAENVQDAVPGKTQQIAAERANAIKNIVDEIEKSNKGFGRSRWKTASGNFNGARLAFDSIAGVVLGTAGGLITSSIIKKNQTKHGFENLKCVINGQIVSDYGDEFTVGVR